MITNMNMNANTQAEEFAIRSLLERYTYAVNTRNWDLYRACWTDDAIWELGQPLNGRHEGIDAIMTEVTKTVESLELFIQMTHAITVTELTDTTAKAVVTLNEIGRPMPGSDFPFPGMFILALYFDDLIKQDGVWKFTHRNYKVAYWDASPLKAEVYQQQWVNTQKYQAA